MHPKTKIKLQDIKIPINDDGVVDYDTIPPYGTVLAFIADRCDYGDPFIVVNESIHDENIKAIFPRMRIRGDKLILGEDRIDLQDKKKMYKIDVANCTCDDRRGADWRPCDNCINSQKRMIENSFKEVDENYEYKIVDIYDFNNYIYLSNIKKEQINDAEHPIFMYVDKCINNKEDLEIAKKENINVKDVRFYQSLKEQVRALENKIRDLRKQMTNMKKKRM